LAIVDVVRFVLFDCSKKTVVRQRFVCCIFNT
jgi:hypothetical protein